ncbi:MAG TPA: hypothetical protein VLW53_22880 [Candidatus Eisenbacteria bacterium]|nr:hypothetical protein [Candidatus Eisenbacteria bacterium]
MRSTLPVWLLCRLAAVLVAAVPALLLTAGPAAAAAPSNDEIGAATEIGQLPFFDAVDLSLATWNFSTDSSACSFNQAQSVWYTFTPATDQKVAFDLSASFSFLAIDIFTGSPGALTRVGCGQTGMSVFGGLVLNLVGGTQYWVMVSSGCCGGSPFVRLAVYPAVAPQATISATGGSVDRGGNATISGVLDCTGVVVVPTQVTGNVRQSVGRLSSVTANFTTPTSCEPGLPWQALAQPAAGKFVGGPATVNAAVQLCNLVGCSTPSTTAVIRL